MKPRRESDILASCLKLLKARGIFALRMNAGAVEREHKGKRRHIRYGLPGMADIFALPWVTQRLGKYNCNYTLPVWIETKRENGDQSRLQIEFETLVNAEGHTYLVVRSAAELETWLRANVG